MEEEREAAGATPATDPTLEVRVSRGRTCGAGERCGGGGTGGEEDHVSAEASGSGECCRRRPGRRQVARARVRRKERNEERRSTTERGLVAGEEEIDTDRTALYRARDTYPRFAEGFRTWAWPSKVVQ
jgi:hypothetical protein